MDPDILHFLRTIGLPGAYGADRHLALSLMVDKHGVAAPQECRRRSIEVFEYGDEEGEAFWEAVARAGESLLVDGPSKDVPGRRRPEVWRDREDSLR